MEIVLNEWLLHYSKADAGKEKQELVYRFLKCIKEKDFIILINWDCPFIKKFQHFWDASKHNQMSSILFKTLHYLMHDSEKAKYTEFNDISSIPKEIIEICPEDDFYLIQLAFHTNERIVVTKDNRIIEKFKGAPRLTFMLPEEFLQKFNC